MPGCGCTMQFFGRGLGVGSVYSLLPAISTGMEKFLALGNLAVSLRRGDFNRVAAFGAPTKLLMVFIWARGGSVRNVLHVSQCSFVIRFVL